MTKHAVADTLTPEQKQARLAALNREVEGLQAAGRPLFPEEVKRRSELFAEIDRLQRPPAAPPEGRAARVLELRDLLREVHELAMDPEHIELRKEARALIHALFRALPEEPRQRTHRYPSEIAGRLIGL